MTVTANGWAAGPVVAEINKLADLQENWDSYGAAKPDPAAIEHAVKVVTELTSITWDPPVVGATPDGWVNLLWRDGERRLSLVVGEDWITADVYRTDGKRTLMLGDIAPDDEYQTIVTVWQAG